MYVTRIPNRDLPPAVLVAESYREGGKVKSRTLAKISDWPEAKIDSLRRVLAGETLRAARSRALRDHPRATNSTPGEEARINASVGLVVLGPTSSTPINVYTGLTGPSSFGSGSLFEDANSGSGSLVECRRVSDWNTDTRRSSRLCIRLPAENKHRYLGRRHLREPRRDARPLHMDMGEWEGRGQL